ncbi:hypothetical protein D9757_013870 [Collybiopsis confluens]|uniref:Histone chaperone RTT106/FACT complex subunit SPT16-like middle domain-containing protein n=1 Tax=Collybiopsis confluens TaxID=2823264 RepID=A0A8H5CPP1_9AGAR|nr:hypothetical protein D9757_013870 [Collybiopsis confluens]
MDSELSFLQVVSASLPEELSNELAALRSSSSSEALLDNLIRFICGADCSYGDVNQWGTQQAIVRRRLGELLASSSSSSSKKRPNSDTGAVAENPASKRQKLSTSLIGNDAEDPPKFTIHSISVSSPIRKKVDVTIHESSIRFINPNPKPDTSAIEAIVPLSSLCRAFLLPTRGKPKAHWTAVIMSNDVPEKGKTPANTGSVNPQIIFGLDATTTAALSSTLYMEEQDDTRTLKKGEETLPLLQQFLSHLSLPHPPVHLSIEKIENFGRFLQQGGAEGVKGQPTLAISANLAAKPGTLWLMPQGILWGESKPCQFWSVADLIPSGVVGGVKGVRTMTATGRVCTVILTRKNAAEEEIEEGRAPAAAAGDEQNLVGEETVFGQIDGKEQEGINQWARKYRSAFGATKSGDVAGVDVNVEESSEARVRSKRSVAGSGQHGQSQPQVNTGPLTISQMIVDSDDEEDADFALDGAGGSDSQSELGSESGEEGSGDEEEEGKADGSGEEEEEDASADEDEDDEKLRPKHHPLLRPGAMPKMSRAAMDIVVDMVERDMVGHGTGQGGGEEQDELDD